MNFLFSVFTSEKGVFCKGSLHKAQELIKKVLQVRNQNEIFNEEVEIENITDQVITVRRNRAIIVFNFSEKPATVSIDDAS